MLVQAYQFNEGNSCANNNKKRYPEEVFMLESTRDLESTNKCQLMKALWCERWPAWMNGGLNKASIVLPLGNRTRRGFPSLRVNTSREEGRQLGGRSRARCALRTPNPPLARVEQGAYIFLIRSAFAPHRSFLETATRWGSISCNMDS